MNKKEITLESIVDPWYRSLSKPDQSQKEVMQSLLQAHSKTKYGEKYNAEKVVDYEDFKKLIPIVSYRDILTYLEEVKRGNFTALLPEPNIRWVMTRGTCGEPKLIPTTKTHLLQILTVGARAIINFALRKNNYGVLQHQVLNLNFPSEVSTISNSVKNEPYGYRSGTYAKINPELYSARLAPSQDEIDALGGGITRKDWENRFELAYQKTKNLQIKTVMGVTPVIVAFATYLKRRHDILPKQIWGIEAIFCTSVAKIQTKYAPQLKHLYGKVSVVEMYAATEGVFAQQLDDNPYICPNYDTYFFEVQTRRGIKMLHEMKPSEWGRIIISSQLILRYDIGDLVESMGKGYFRVFGRAKVLTIFEHLLFNIITGRSL